MSGIPPGMYERVHELALALANASEAGDEVLSDSCLGALRAYYDELAAVGQSHPFVTETLADFVDAAEAVNLYRLALGQSRAHPEEPTHTKMISLAERLIELGQSEQAEAFLRDGRAEAVRRDDAFSIEEADRLRNDLDG